MTDILGVAGAVLALLLTLAALVLFARGDAFAAPGTGHRPADELATTGARRRF